MFVHSNDDDDVLSTRFPLARSTKREKHVQSWNFNFRNKNTNYLRV